MRQMSVLEQLAAEAIRLGADAMEVEYKDGHEGVFAVLGGIGYGIARLPSSSREAEELRRELYGLTKKRGRVATGGLEYELRARVYGSFGEDAFHVQLRRV